MISSNDSLESLDLLSDEDCCSMGTAGQALSGTCTFWIEGVFVVIVGAFGILGNLLSISVLCSSVEMKNVFNLLLILLSSVDSILIALAMLDYSFVRAFSLDFDLYVYSFPYFLYPTTNIVLCTSIFLVLAVAFERYLAVCRPYHYRTIASTQSVGERIAKLTLPVFILAILINIPKFFETEIVEKDVNGTLEVSYVVTDLRKNPTYINYYVNWLRLLGTGVIPMGLLIFLNVNIYLKLVETRKKRTEGKSNSLRARRKQQQHSKGQPSPAVISKADNNNGQQSAQQNRSASEESSKQRLLPAVAAASSSASTWQQQRQHQQQQHEEELSRRDIRMATILLTIVLVFVFCHLPRVLLNLHEFFMVTLMITCGERFCPPAWFLCGISFNHLLLVINSSVNILVYCSVGEKFREGLKARLRIQKLCKMRDRIGKRCGSFTELRWLSSCQGRRRRFIQLLAQLVMAKTSTWSYWPRRRERGSRSRRSSQRSSFPGEKKLW